MSDKEIVLVGYSGHAFVLAEAASSSGMNLKHYTEKKESLKNPFNLNYLGYEGDEDFKGWDFNYGFILGIGDNVIRTRVARLIKSRGAELINVIHKQASISSNVKLGKGVFIARNAAVNPLSDIQDYTIINTGSIIEHECTIGSGSHIGPGAVLAGNVKVGANCFIGANAVIKQGVTIGDNVIVGAGSVVIRDLGNNKKVVGNPSREL